MFDDELQDKRQKHKARVTCASLPLRRAHLAGREVDSQRPVHSEREQRAVFAGVLWGEGGGGEMWKQR